MNDRTSSLDLQVWNAAKCYLGKPPEIRWLVEGTIPSGVPVLLAAAGDTGKSFLALKLALAVACYMYPGEPILGGQVRVSGTAVIFTAEENKHDVHRRLAALDPNEKRKEHGAKLIVVPLPDAGGPIPLIKQNHQGFSATSQFKMIRRQLLVIEDLALVVFDPLQAFAAADINADPAAGQFFCSLMGTLAAETGATMLTTHHMRKPDRNQNSIMTPVQAREAVRGTTALVDGMRCVYALWPAPKKRAGDVSRKLDVKVSSNGVVYGAVVKANGPADLAVRTYIRDHAGVLIDRTDDLRQAMPGREDQLVDLRKAIADGAERGYPFIKTGLNGVHSRRSPSGAM